MIREFWDKVPGKIDGLALRERVMVFSAVVSLLALLVAALWFDPLFERHKQLSKQLQQQQDAVKSVQAQFEALAQARKDDAASPLRDRIRQLRQRVDEGELYLKQRRDRLVPPEKMSGLLEQVLGKNGRLQLVALETLAPTPLSGDATDKPEGTVPVKSDGRDRQLYKHGVKIVLRGSYADMLQYLEALERLQAQMLWGAVKMEVVQHPTVELTLTLYTLSLDTTWLQV